MLHFRVVQPFGSHGTNYMYYMVSQNFDAVSLLFLRSILSDDILGTNFDRKEFGDNFGYFRQNNGFNQTKICPKYVMPFT